MITEQEHVLLDRIAHGDHEAFQQLYARYSSRLAGYLWRLVDGDRGLVEDLVQECFLAIWRSAAQFRGQATVTTWIFQIAHHAAANQRRSYRRRIEGQGTYSLDGMDDDLLPHTSGSASDDTIIEQMTLAEAIRSLPDGQREALELVYYQGCTLDEVADIMQIPYGTVKSRLFAARRALAQHLAEEAV